MHSHKQHMTHEATNLGMYRMKTSKHFRKESLEYAEFFIEAIVVYLCQDGALGKRHRNLCVRLIASEDTGIKATD